MVDSGAQLNVVKKDKLDQRLLADTNIKYDLVGINQTPVSTHGQVILRVGDRHVAFQVVKDDFTLKEDAILGSKFFEDEEVDISYSQKCLKIGDLKIPFAQNEEITIPPNCKKLIYVRVANYKQTPVGYLPRVKSPPNLFIGECILKAENGIGFIYAINTSNKTETIITPIVELTPIQIQETDTAYIKNIAADTEDNRTTQLLQKINLSHLDEYEHEEVTKLIEANADIFHLEGEQLTMTNLIEHKIELTDPTPVRVKVYRYPLCQRKELEDQTRKLLSQNIIRPSRSSFSSPAWLVPKASPDGTKRLRMVVDFRKLNEHTVRHVFPLPNITELIDSIQKAQYFTTLDLASGFHQIPVAEEDKHKTAFSTPSGLWEWNAMPFGMVNSPATFQSLINSVLAGLLDEIPVKFRPFRTIEYLQIPRK